jgi:hypothetical protein
MVKVAGKYVTEKTFEKHMGSIAKSFGRIDSSLERHEKVLIEILKQLKNINEESRYFRTSISNLNIEGSSYDRRIENLTLRVERLESKER